MSKGLEALRKIEIHLDYLDETYNVNYGEEFDTIEKELKDYYALKKECEEAKWYQEHKALEIIKEKGIDWRRFMFCNSYEEYNEPIIKFALLDIKPYTQEEWDLLKEVLL